MFCNINSSQFNNISNIDTKNTFLSSLTKNENIFQFKFTKLTKIKVLANFCSNKELSLLWNKMSKGNLTWNNIQLVYEEKDNPDYYVIINKPIHDKYDKSKTIVFRMEPDTDLLSKNTVKNHWDDWYNSKDEFLYFCDLNRYRNNTEWHLGSNYNQLLNQCNNIINKTKLFSSVCSSLYNMDGHKFRIDLLKYIENKNEVSIDIYGRENLFNFKNYRGSLPSHNKDDGILPYKYTFISENCDRENYFTEKITDAILGETLCFYWGCKNINDFIDEKAFIKLPFNLEEAYKIIKTSINNNEWEKRITYIKTEKMKLLDYYNFFPRIENLINISNLTKVIYYTDEKLSLIVNNLKQHDIKHYNLVKEGTSVNINGHAIIINGLIISEHFNDKLAIVYSKLKNVDWSILILDSGEINNSEYCEIIKVEDIKENLKIINNYKSYIINDKNKNNIIYKTEHRLINF